MAKLSCIIKDPGKNPRHVHISDTLENFQRTVGGYIETITVQPGIVMIINEEGKLHGLPANFIFGKDLIVGTAIFVGTDGEDFADIPVTFKEFKGLFPALFV